MMKKKVAFTVIIILFTGFVYIGESAHDVSINKISEAVIPCLASDNLSKAGDRKLMRFMDIDCKSIDSYIYYISEESLCVSELLVIKADSRKDAAGLEEKVEERITSRRNAFAGYGPEQVKLLDNSIVSTRGKYLFFCVSENNEKAEEAFRSVIQ